MSWDITSERLALRPVEVDDAAALHTLWTDERVRHFLWDGDVIPLEQTREIVATSRALFEEQGFGIWGVRERGASELIGFAGYWHFRTPPALELLFGVAAEHWNRGVASEAARWVIDYGFERLGLRRVDASTDVGNAASVAVLDRLGMRRAKRDVVDGIDTVFYAVTRDEWER